MPRISSLKKRDNRVLGEGEHAIVYEVRCGKTVCAQKKSRHAPTEADLIEAEVGRHMGELGIGPKVYDTTTTPHFITIQMEMVDTVEAAKVVGDAAFARKIVDLVIKMVDSGYVHNDLHKANIGRSRATRRALLIDFSLVRKVGALSSVARAQVILAQLYALVDPCNTNNVGTKTIDALTPLNSWIAGSCVNAIGDAIYAIRHGNEPVVGVCPMRWQPPRQRNLGSSRSIREQRATDEEPQPTRGSEKLS